LTIIIVSHLTSYDLLYTSKWGEEATKEAMEVVTEVVMELAPKLATSATSLDT
jgi:hypothetical protein